MEKMRGLLDVGIDRQRSESEELAGVLADEILNTKDLSEEEQADIIRQLEIQTLQMMDEIYAQEDSQMEEQNYEERLLSGRGSEDDIDTEQRLYEFQRTIEKLRTTFREKKLLKKAEAEAEAD